MRRTLLVALLAAGCGQPDAAAPNPALKVPDIPKGRGAAQSAPPVQAATGGGTSAGRAK